MTVRAVSRCGARRSCARVSASLDKVHKRGTARFIMLVLMIIATAVIVTIAMFQTLAYVMG